VHARTAFGGACASSMPDPALRLLQHYERHTSTIPIGRSSPRPPDGLTHRPFTNDSPRRINRLQRATRLDLDASHCLEAAPSEEEDPGHRSPFPVRARARAERTDEARVKVKSAQFPGGPVARAASDTAEGLRSPRPFSMPHRAPRVAEPGSDAGWCLHLRSRSA